MVIHIVYAILMRGRDRVKKPVREVVKVLASGVPVGGLPATVGLVGRVVGLHLSGLSVPESASLLQVPEDTVKAIVFEFQAVSGESGGAIPGAVELSNNMLALVLGEYARRFVLSQVARDSLPASGDLPADLLDRERLALESAIDSAAERLLAIHTVCAKVAGAGGAGAGRGGGMGYPPLAAGGKKGAYPHPSTYYKNLAVTPDLVQDAISMQERHLKDLRKFQKGVKEREIVSRETFVGTSGDPVPDSAEKEHDEVGDGSEEGPIEKA